MKYRTMIGAGLLSLVLALGPAAAQESAPRYQQWPGNNGAPPDVDKLVQQLEKLIDQAEHDRAADPQFLSDLRDVLGDYRNPWQDRLLYDDFRDGNYAYNPTWTVTSGAFKVDTKGNTTGLRSTIVAPGTSVKSNPTLNILGTLLGNPNPQTSVSDAPYAAIYTTLRISNAFVVRLEFMSGERRGRIDFGPYQGPAGSVAYRVAYIPGQATDSLKLIRITQKGAVTIGSYPGPLNLEDGRRHLLEWRRDRRGAMTVSLDGRDMITAQDRTIPRPFDGMLLINSGGTYWVRSLAIDGTRT
jgi:hypothetical protein